MNPSLQHSNPLLLQKLEDRTVPAVIVVSTLADTVAVDGAVSLREAIQSINASSNINADVTAADYGQSDQIQFTGLSGTITLASNLDAITRQVAVSGNTGAGFTDKPVITVDGANSFSTFTITGPSVILSNLAIIRSSMEGVLITGASANGAMIQGNFIGIDSTGTTVASNQNPGIRITGGATAASVGGISSDRNVISGNVGAQIQIDGLGTSNNTVAGNIIGLDATGTLPIRVGNGVILSNNASNNTIGGITPAERNIISGSSTGIIINEGASGNSVLGNFIGTTASGAAGAQNNRGILIASGASGNNIGGTSVGAGNLIAFNTLQGVLIQTGFGGSADPLGNQVLGNSIHSNGALGIDLGATGVTANDNLDRDTGANDLQNYPILASAVGNQIFGSIHSTPSVTLRVEFFSSISRDASGFGEGRTYLGFLDITPDPFGNASFTFNAPSSLVGLFASATATPIFGSTSEFSNSVLGLPLPPIVMTPTPQQIPNPNPAIIPTLIPLLVPQLLTGTPLVVPLLIPNAIPQTIPQPMPLLVPTLTRTFAPVLNTPLTPAAGIPILFPKPGEPTVTTGQPAVIAGQVSPTAGASLLLPKAPLVVGAGLNGQSIVVVYNADATERGRLTAFPGFLGGVRVGTADVNNDGHADILAAAGIGGSPHVKVFDGVTGAEIRSFFAYDPSFTGGVYVAGGDLNGDGFAEIITGTGAGGDPHVKVFDGATGQELASFYAYALGFGGGVTVAAGDINNDGLVDIVTGAGPGGSPHVKIIEGTSLNQTNPDGTIAQSALLASYYAYDVTFGGGVFVTSGSDLNGDGLVDVVTGAGPGGGPHVKIVDTSRMNTLDPDSRIADASLISSFFGFEEGFQGGVRVGEADALQDGVNEIILGAGTGGGPRVRVLRANGLAAAQDFFAFVPEYAGGVFVD